MVQLTGARVKRLAMLGFYYSSKTVEEIDPFPPCASSSPKAVLFDRLFSFRKPTFRSLCASDEDVVDWNVDCADILVCVGAHCKSAERTELNNVSDHPHDEETHADRLRDAQEFASVRCD